MKSRSARLQGLQTLAEMQEYLDLMSTSGTYSIMVFNHFPAELFMHVYTLHVMCIMVLCIVFHS